MEFGEYDFRTFTFGIGSHDRREDGMCVMEAVAYVAGEPHSDHPQCACPVISAFMRSWNDSITDDARRRELLSPFVFRLPGTKATAEIELQRSWMAFDWLVRECAAEFLSLSPVLQKHAEILRGLPLIDQTNFDIAIPVICSARAAACDAARDAALRSAFDSAAACSARAAACDAARDAALRSAFDSAAACSAWATACVSACDAARAAAFYSAAACSAWATACVSACDAARAAACVSACDAVRDVLKPPAKRLQDSAALLLDRMIRLTEPQEQTVEASQLSLAAK